jgi:hypothetical protein
MCLSVFKHLVKSVTNQPASWKRQRETELGKCFDIVYERVAFCLVCINRAIVIYFLAVLYRCEILSLSLRRKDTVREHSRPER